MNETFWTRRLCDVAKTGDEPYLHYVFVVKQFKSNLKLINKSI